MSIRARGERPPGRGGGAESPPFEDVESVGERTLVALSKIGLALREQAWRDSAPRGLNPTQAQVLIVLARPGAAPLRLSAIARQLGVNAPTASDSVSALEAKGLVVKGADPKDGRALAVRPTPEGRVLARELSEWPDVLLEAVALLDGEESAVLMRTLLTVIRGLQERGRIAPARMCVTCRYFRPHAHTDPAAPHHCALVDAPFGDRSLRVDCVDHDPADPQAAARLWEAFRA
ncbi:MAG: MarR family winged helix-turn-helix transcriptional regulator [Longimicrobiales bacterium]|nr:MarR family winged helix-turn-helix transcriptional regulator [Longimicrobiales bacterium]